MQFNAGSRMVDLDKKVLLMGILNTTPDSFSDGGRFHEIDAAIRHAESMRAEGAEIIDVGGESTRPGSEGVSVQAEEMADRAAALSPSGAAARVSLIHECIRSIRQNANRQAALDALLFRLRALR